MVTGWHSGTVVTIGAAVGSVEVTPAKSNEVSFIDAESLFMAGIMEVLSVLS